MNKHTHNSRRSFLTLGVLLIGLTMSVGCSTNKGKGANDVTILGNAVPEAHPDLKWRHLYMIETAHNCMASKAGNLKKPKGPYTLHFSRPVGRSNGRPELRRENGWIIYGEAWRDGGRYHIALPNNGDGFPDQAVHLHEGGHLTEFASGFQRFHDQRFKDCFGGTFWVQRSGRAIGNLLPGPDKPLLKPIDRPNIRYRMIERGGKLITQHGVPIPGFVAPVNPSPVVESLPDGTPWTPTVNDFLKAAEQAKEETEE